jgi:hypothetical protein
MDPQSLNRYVYARNNPLAITDPTGHSWWGSITSAVSNIAQSISTAASAVSNTWSSIPQPAQDVILVGAAVAATVLTGGAAAPVLLEAGLAVGGGATAGYAGFEEATGGSITAEGALSAFATGFSLGTAVGDVASGAGLLSSAESIDGLSVDDAAGASFRNEELLASHFLKHAAEFSDSGGFATAQDYLQGALSS